MGKETNGHGVEPDGNEVEGAPGASGARKVADPMGLGSVLVALAAMKADKAQPASEELEEVVRKLADETGAQPEALRLVLGSLRSGSDNVSLPTRIKRQWTRMSNVTKRIAISSFLGLQFAQFGQLSNKFGDDSGLFQIGQIVIAALGLCSLALTRRMDLGAIAGAAFGFAATVGMAIFALILQAPSGVEPFSILPATGGGALAGAAIAYLASMVNRRSPGGSDSRRTELLRQLVELQDELKQTEQVITFLCMDVVSSTRIKAATDPLASEYTFGEYTKFVVDSGKQFEGKLHSTAGDGILLTFEHPRQAFQAARRIQGGMIEFNSFRNKTGQPFELRCGIHTGAVMIAGGDARSVEYSHVIDVTAHVQRVAPIGGIAITDDAAVFLPGGGRSVGDETTEIQGEKVFLWRPASTTPELRGAMQPPPLPPAAP
ncbi:MAG: adenylate/guanylate cyclase domain-containing protein [Fimbriimonadales bacterium]